MLRALLLITACILVVSSPVRSDQVVPVTLTGTVRYAEIGKPTIIWTGDSTVTLSAVLPDLRTQILATTSTDAAGRFAFFGLTLQPGTYQLNAVLEQNGASNAAPLAIVATDANRTIDTTIDTSVLAVRGAPAQTDPFITVPVFYATDRKQLPSDVAGVDFGNDVSSPYQLSYGKALVTIPRTHVKGELEGPDISLDLRADKVNHIVITHIGLSTEDGFFHDLVADLDATKAQNPRRRIIVFIHGYRQGFDHAIRVAAQIKYDLHPLDATMVLYSWPSRDTLFGYFDDQTSSENTVPALKTFLIKLVGQSDGAEVSVIAHSMGNFALTQALLQIANDPSIKAAPFDKIIMAAPDVPAADIANSSCKLARLSNGMTLYASNHDQALLAATAISGMQNLTGFRKEDPIRAGLETPLLVALGLDTVDASSAITDFLGHGYFNSDVNILSDIQEVIAGAPMPRAHLVAEKAANHDYWMFSPKPAPTTPQRIALPMCPPRSH